MMNVRVTSTRAKLLVYHSGAIENSDLQSGLALFLVRAGPEIL